MDVLNIESKLEGDLKVFRLSGGIDERSDFSPIAACPDATVKIDFGGIISVNSFGVKKWVGMLQALTGKQIIYENCPTVIVEQMNVISLLRKNIELLSFHLPFGCESCDIEVDKLVSIDDVRSEGFMDSLNELYDCERCRGHLEFQDDEDMYFSFLQD